MELNANAPTWLIELAGLVTYKNCPLGSMALTNIALDLNGQAQNWLEYAAELDDQKRTPDMLAFQRDAGEFRNCLLVEHPNQDFAYTMARQFYFDTWHNLMLNELLDSSDQRIREISEKSL